MRPIEKVLNALQQQNKTVKDLGNGQWQASSPCRSDSNPSLSISEGKDGKVLLNDFGPNTTEENLAALGLTEKDLFPPYNHPQKPQGNYNTAKQPDIIYSYRDEMGREVGQVCRQNLPNGEKAIRPRHLDKGNWEYKKPVTGFPLYRLPELLSADYDLWVHLTEGEKDADTLVGLGLVATTNAFGSKSWDDKYNPYFTGRKVVIHQDNDPAGQKRVCDLSLKLYGIASEVKIITPKDIKIEDISHGDVTDAITLGRVSAFDLDLLCNTLPAYAPPSRVLERERVWTFGELTAATFSPRKWIVEELLTDGLALLAGKQKSGKSWLTLQLIASISNGSDFLGFKTQKTKCLYLALEDGPKRLQERHNISSSTVETSSIIKFTWENLKDDGIDKLGDFITTHGIGFVAIDTFTKACPGLRQKDIEAVAPLMSGLSNLALQHEIAILVIDHLKKPNGNDPDSLYDVYGSIAKTTMADVIWNLKRDKDDFGQFTAEGRDLSKEYSLATKFNRTFLTWENLGDFEDVRQAGKWNEVLEAFKDLGEATTQEIANYLGKDSGNISRIVQELHKAGKIVRLPKRGKEQPYELMH